MVDGGGGCQISIFPMFKKVHIVLRGGGALFIQRPSSIPDFRVVQRQDLILKKQFSVLQPLCCEIVLHWKIPIPSIIFFYSVLLLTRPLILNMNLESYHMFLS